MITKTVKAKENIKKRNEELVDRGLKVIKHNPPRRFLALDDWGAAALTPEEFEALREGVRHSNLLNSHARFSKYLYDEVITRACDLLFALVESGGLCVKQPQKILPKIKFETAMATYGYLKQHPVKEG